MKGRPRSPPERACPSASLCTSARMRRLRRPWRTWSRRSRGRSCTKWGITSVWTRTTFLINGSAESPEGAVPEDERVARAGGRCGHLANADVVVSGRVELNEPAFEPGGASLDQRDPVGSQPVGYAFPPRIHRRRSAGEPVREEFLRAGEHAHGGGTGFGDGHSSGRLALESHEHHRRLDRDR